MKEQKTTDSQGNVEIQQWADSDYPLRFANEDVIIDTLRQSLIVNRLFISSLKPQTAAAQASAAYDQAVKMAKQMNAIIKLKLDLLDDLDGV